MEYIIIRDDDIIDLSRTINQMITEGWKPIGGISGVRIGRKPEYEEVLYLQAMIKKQKRSLVVSKK